MNKVLTIPKKIANRSNDIVISRGEYEILLKKSGLVSVAKLTPKEKRSILKSGKELASGKYLSLKEISRRTSVTY